MMRKLSLLLFLFTALQFGKAQSPQLKFDHFTIKDGLPQEDCTFVKQDDHGYLWIGTPNGIVRYDGYKFKVYPLVTGKGAFIPPCAVISMVTDENKNLWFSTVGNGLFRYDRLSDSFTQFKYSHANGKNNNVYQYLQFVDQAGNLWGFDGIFGDDEARVVKFDQKNKQFTLFGDDQKIPGFLKLSADIRKPADVLFKSPSGGHSIWLGTNSGLWIYNEKIKTFSAYLASKDTSNQKSVENIYEAPSEPGILWLTVYNHGSNQYHIERLNTRDKTFKEYGHDTNPELTASNDTVTNVYEDTKHRLWLGTEKGLLFFNRKTKTFTDFLPADTGEVAGQNRIYNITEGKNGSLWLITGKGLLNFDPENHHFQRYAADADNPDALNSNKVNCLLSDRSGVLWAGTYDHGLDKLNTLSTVFGTYTRNYTKPGGYPGGTTQQVSVTYDRSILFTTERGIYKWSAESDVFTPVYKLKKTDPKLGAIAAGIDTMVYFCDSSGFKVFNPLLDQLQSYRADTNDYSSIGSNNINYILQDHTGLVWIATNDRGMCSFDPSTHIFSRYPFITNDGTRESGNKLDDKKALTIYEDRRGTIWVGTNLGGLNSFDRKTGQFYSFLLYTKQHIFGITSILEDYAGHLWVGTNSFGLFEFDRKLDQYIKHIDESNGLLSNSIAGITKDDKGFLWISSAMGLTRLDPRKMSFKTFPINNILPGKTISQSLHNFIAVKGKIVIGLVNGITAFDPARLTEGDHHPPSVYIETVSYSEPGSGSDSVTMPVINGLDKLRLAWEQNRITFNCVAVHLANPMQNKYAYLLEGFDKQWVMAGTQRRITYNNLLPGTYTFRVKAANSDGIWNNEGANFTFVIGVPWWHSLWIKVLYVILALGAIYAFAAIRSLKISYDKRKLEHRVNVRNEEVIQQKHDIEAQRDYLEKTVSELKLTQTQLIHSAKMASLGELTAGIANEIQGPLNFVNNFAEVNQQMIDELKKELKKGQVDEALSIADDIQQNEEKISHHGKRADFIVKGMLDHSRSSTGDRKAASINVLADEFFKLSFHVLRAKDKSFNADMITRFDPNLPKIKIVQQDIGRVFLNLFNNAFYSVNQKRKTTGKDYDPEVLVTTYFEDGQIIIKVKDNGTGIPEAIKDKIMQPFFTTKPNGEGIGLGLSLTYETVKEHGGSIEVNSIEGEGAEFVVSLPVSWSS